MANQEIIRMLGEYHSFDILEALLQSPKRFSDLNKACPIEKTRAKRLKELKVEGLVQIIVKERGKKDFMHYNLTEKGETILRKVKEF